MFRKTLVWLTVGFAIGTAVSMWFGPNVVTWWGTPGGATVLSCESSIRWATTSLIKFQLGVGGALGLLLAIFINVWNRRARATPPASPSPRP